MQVALPIKKEIHQIIQFMNDDIGLIKDAWISEISLTKREKQYIEYLGYDIEKRPGDCGLWITNRTKFNNASTNTSTQFSKVK